ncbi:MAG: nicotinate phosphoribosyltransferase [Gammaproteobacteria bacterium]
MIDAQRSPLLTDLYQLTMLEAYFQIGVEDTAVFEFFVRQLPETRNFLVAAGLEQTLSFLEGLCFDQEELAWLAASGKFKPDLIDRLADLRFTGDVDAMAEGTVFFADEPILRVIAPMPEAQLVESRLVNLLHLQTLVASKAARCVLTAPDKQLVDFGMRRAHGAEAAMAAARASYLAGFAATATVLAEQRFGIPTVGTMAHSFVQAHDREEDAFENFARCHPDNAVLLIDTYDTLRGARRVVELASRLATEGIVLRGVRIDSGDLGELSREVRKILDAGGCAELKIFLSGSLDEYRLDELLRAQTPADGFGIGTHLDVSDDAPSLDCVYKLQEYAGTPRRKRSSGKATWPGRKQVFRQLDGAGRLSGDLLGLLDEEIPGHKLLHPVMRGGERRSAAPTLLQSREYCARQLASLPEPLRGLHSGGIPYPVGVSDALSALATRVDAAFA